MTEASRVRKLLIEKNAEIDRLKNHNKKFESALHQWDDLIRHTFNGSSKAMSDMQNAIHITAALLHGDAPWPETRIEKLEAALRHCINALRQYEMGDDRPRGPIPNDDLRPWLLGAMDNAIKVLEGKDD
jgi:hypothetical protein